MPVHVSPYVVARLGRARSLLDERAGRLSWRTGVPDVSRAGAPPAPAPPPGPGGAVGGGEDADVGLGRAGVQVELRGDLGVGGAGAQQSEDVPFCRYRVCDPARVRRALVTVASWPKAVSRQHHRSGAGRLPGDLVDGGDAVTGHADVEDGDVDGTGARVQPALRTASSRSCLSTARMVSSRSATTSRSNSTVSASSRTWSGSCRREVSVSLRGSGSPSCPVP